METFTVKLDEAEMYDLLDCLERSINRSDLGSERRVRLEKLHERLELIYEGRV